MLWTVFEGSAPLTCMSDLHMIFALRLHAQAPDANSAVRPVLAKQ